MELNEFEELIKEENTFRGLAKGEIETVFDKLTGYGLDLLGDVVSAWQYDHEEDSKILMNAYLDMRAVKEHDERDAYITPLSQVSELTEKELQFMEDILEIDPYNDNPYTNNKNYEGQEDFESETVGINPYDEIRKYVDQERQFRFEVSNNSSNLFYKRYYVSMLNSKKIVDTNELFQRRFNRSMYNGNVDTNELFSNRFNKSMQKKLGYNPGDLSPYSK